MQALESAALSLADFRVRSGFASQRLRRRDVADAIKVVHWCFSLKNASSMRTAYALERHFEQDTSWVNRDGMASHCRQWSRYDTGETEPRRVLAAVDRNYPGINASLASPLWPALTSKPLNKRQLVALIRRLLPRLPSPLGIQLTNAGRNEKDRFDRKLAVALEQHASLDTLAATVVLLRLASVEGQSECAYLWGRRVLRKMLMLGDQLHAAGVARALFELIEERILPLAQHDGFQPAYPVGTYGGVWQAYSRAFWQARCSAKRGLSDVLANRIGQRILDDRHGYDYFHALNPLRLWAETATLPAEQQLFAKQDVCLFTWAHNMLSIGRHPLPPPYDAWTGADLWATRGGSRGSPSKLPDAPVGSGSTSMEIDPAYQGTAKPAAAMQTPADEMKRQASLGVGVPLAKDRRETAALTDAVIQLTSPSFGAGAAIPSKHSEYADGVSPQLNWRAVANAKSYVLLVEDPDAKPITPFVHWVAWNIPGDVTSLPEGLQEQDRLTEPPGLMQGATSRGSVGYYGPRPPVGDPPHHYHFQLLALDTMLQLPLGATRDTVLAAAKGHVIGKGELVGTYAQEVKPPK